MAEMKAGEYRVIGDVLTLKKGTGDKATYDQHKRGAVVKLSADQAQAFGAGTRPLVVPHKAAVEPAASTTEEPAKEKADDGGKAGT